MEERRNPDNVLLRLQCDEIEHYANQFPQMERERRMMEWIQKYAEAYRENMDQVMVFVERQLKESDESK